MFADSIYVYGNEERYKLSSAVQALVEFYLSGIFDFEKAVSLLIEKKHINGSIE